ncbi:STAS domain-containing protein [Vibrio sp. WXL210]|uniref:STAS domain-containing protein n=1 Tax=Vibrio sp. WXL210 TaxID=3450709 RepID=UPI003EC7AF35
MSAIKLNGQDIHLSGPLDRDTVPALWQQLSTWKPAFEQHRLDLSEIERIDSAGMVMLIHLIEHAKSENCHIMLCFVPEELGTLFRLSNVESLLAEHIKN